jgi:hypothetical protein
MNRKVKDPGSESQAGQHRALVAKLRRRALEQADNPEITGKAAVQLYFEGFKIDQAERKLSGETEAIEAARRANDELNAEWFEEIEVPE